jgi:hypothetical protein
MSRADLTTSPESPMPTRATLDAAVREYADAARPGSQTAILTIAGPGPGQYTHVTFDLGPVRPTAASVRPVALS